jgi:gas vesicle protein
MTLIDNTIFQIYHSSFHKGYMMHKVFSFMAGAICGTLVGGVTALLLTPASGDDLRQQATNRWEEAMAEYRRASQLAQLEMESEFERLKSGG